jgi:signal transduction histidine kinase
MFAAEESRGAHIAVELRKLHDVTREMVEADTRTELFETATAVASDLLGFEYSTIRERTRVRGEERLVPVAASSTLLRSDGERRTYGRDESIQWNAIETGEVLALPDVSDVADGVDRPDGGSMVVVPLGSDGVLTLGSPRRRGISHSDVELARVLGANLETAMERVDQLRALREREERLAEKNERLDRFAGMIAHEFRNPIGIVAGHLELVVGTEEDQPHLEAAREATDRMDRLTESLLDLVRTDTTVGSVEEIRVDSLARDVFDTVCPDAASFTATAATTVEASRARLRTILENLLDNAVRYGGDDVHVWVGRLPARGPGSDSDSDSDRGFYLADDGPGFDSTDAEELLSYRASGGAESTGLGLAIVRDVAAAHGWSVDVRESRAGGARIEFSIPDGGPEDDRDRERDWNLDRDRDRDRDRERGG